MPSMYLYFVVKTAIFLPKMATNTLRLMGFSSENDWKITAWFSSGYKHSTLNV